MELVIVTGMSGAGKTTAIRVFEDMGYYCVDNLPPELLPNLREIYAGDTGHNGKLAVVVDVRSGEHFCGFVSAFSKLSGGFNTSRILFLDSSDEVLVQRFKETRRRHPLFDQCHGILDSIASERKILVDLKEVADKILDTSDVDPTRLKSEIISYFGADSSDAGMIITVTSFGFKFGLPLDADLVFDVRFLINPHYVPELRPFDGRDQPVEEYVMQPEMSRVFLDKLKDFIGFSLPHYQNEGKAYLNIAIGCTGGRHRSVTIANQLGSFLRGEGYRTIVGHRDVAKG